MTIEFGDTVVDMVTNLAGIAIGRVNYITGCEQILLQPPVKKDGTFIESRWVDVDRLRVGTAKRVVLTSPVRIGGAGPDKPAPTR